MFETWRKQTNMPVTQSNMWARFNRPLLTLDGPKWYSSSWWPVESLSVKQHALLRILAVAQSERLEMKPLVLALADEQRGWYRRRLQQLARRMNGNATLVAALEKTPDVLSDHTVLALRLGTQSGTLSQTFEQLLQSESLSASSMQTSPSRGYWLVLGVVISLMTVMLMFFITPTFKRLSEAFSIRPPEPFLWLCKSVDFLFHNATWIFIAILFLAWVIYYSPFRRIVRRRIYPRLFKSNSITISSRLFEMFAVATAAGRPLPAALSTLAKYHFDATTRQRLLIARNEVEQGVPAWYSLVDAKIISQEEYQAIQGAASSEVQAWTLRKIAAIKKHQVAQIGQTKAAFLHPLCILFFASIVLWICYSFLGVNINLIQSLARW